MAHTLSDEGVVNGFSFARTRKYENGTSLDYEALCSRLVAYARLPQNLAVAYALLCSSDVPASLITEGTIPPRALELPFGMAPERFEATLSAVAKKHRAMKLVGKGFERQGSEKASFSFELVPDGVKQKYAYLNFGDAELRETRKDLNRAKSPWTDDAANLAERLIPDIHDRGDRTPESFLLFQFPRMMTQVKSEGETILGKIEKGRAQAQKLLREQISDASEIAAFTHKKPVRIQVEFKENSITLTPDDWATDASTNDSTRASLERMTSRYGLRGLSAMLTDPPDLLSYLTADAVKILPDAIKYTL